MGITATGEPYLSRSCEHTCALTEDKLWIQSLLQEVLQQAVHITAASSPSRDVGRTS